MPELWSQAALSQLADEMRQFEVFPLFISQFCSAEPTHPLTSSLNRALRQGEATLTSLAEEEWSDFLSAKSDHLLFLMGMSKTTRLGTKSVEQATRWSLVEDLNRFYFDLSRYLTESVPTNSLVLEKFPELARHFSEECLLDLNAPGLEKSRDGLLYYKGQLIYLHPFLRREYASGMNRDFSRRLLRFHATQDASTKTSIAIDHHRLAERGRSWIIEERDAWYGPPFNWSGIDNQNCVGLTTHYRPEDSAHRLSNTLEETQFLWTYRNGIKTLQIEELRRTTKIDTILNRYVHSQRDISDQRFKHLDGAVKVYFGDKYVRRRQLKLGAGTETKAKIKCKVFRIDSSRIDESSWRELIAFFFRQNEMVLEYLEAADPIFGS